VRRIRVLVIDDSAFNRRTITKILEEIPGVEVAGYAVDGEEGVRRFLELRPDLVTLDLEMPRMDGFTLLRIIMGNRPTPVIVVSSFGGDERVFRALELGAVDFILKPTAGPSGELQDIRGDLRDKVSGVFNLNMSCVRKQGELLATRAGRDVITPERSVKPSGKIIRTSVSVVAIGASTGGPPALQSIIAAFPGDLPFSVVVSQHMPAGFTRTFAERLNRISSLEVAEASDGEIIRPGTVLIAPGGRNMTFQRAAGQVAVCLEEPDAEDHCIPSVDRMLSSGAEVFGPKLLALILTGMGVDGSKGIMAVKKAGGQILSESEESAVIFGMPRAAIATGMVDAVIPLDRMPDEIIRRCGVDA
jgi:two-component system, chemotaxis family, protein-glutamate methylesterase/glutaminase